MGAGELAKLLAALLGQPRDRGAAVVGRMARLDQSFTRQRLDAVGDVAVGDEQRGRERAHAEPVGMAIERGEHVEARQRRATLGEAALQLLLDRLRAGQQAQPDPHVRAVAELALMLLRYRHDMLHMISPPATAIAWPVTERLSGRHSQATVLATSRGETSRPCGLNEVKRARTVSASRPVLARIAAIALSMMSVSVKPGQTALAVASVSASSRASARIRPTAPCLAAT